VASCALCIDRLKARRLLWQALLRQATGLLLFISSITLLVHKFSWETRPTIYKS
jgi:hypothetical protein